MEQIKEEIVVNMEFIKKNINYINIINKIIQTNKDNCRLKDIIANIHDKSPQLKQYYIDNNENFEKSHSKSEKDKGLLGKMIEFLIFGNLPNSNSCPDLEYADIKVTHFKKIKGMNDSKTYLNAKERLTLTNISGKNPCSEENISYFTEKVKLEDTKYYTKIRKGIIIIAEHEPSCKYNTIDDYYNKKILGIILYDLDELSEEDKYIITDDYNKIRNCIITGDVSQKGQQYLHVHKHGSKNSHNRAFGFTNKFLTKLISQYLQLPLIKKNVSLFVEF
jgi:hypothetical protein